MAVSESKLQLVRRHIRAFPDFPKKGIFFKDICPILKDPAALTAVIDLFEEHVRNNHQQVDLVVGLDARGFLFGPLLAQRLGVGFVLVRKKGKLPGPTISVAYDLEYEKAEAEIQEDAVTPGQKVLLIDDLLATGGERIPDVCEDVTTPYYTIFQVLGGKKWYRNVMQPVATFLLLTPCTLLLTARLDPQKENRGRRRVSADMDTTTDF